MFMQLYKDACDLLKKGAFIRSPLITQILVDAIYIISAMIKKRERNDAFSMSPCLANIGSFLFTF
jgi:hypothetical protein